MKAWSLTFTYYSGDEVATIEIFDYKPTREQALAALEGVTIEQFVQLQTLTSHLSSWVRDYWPEDADEPSGDLFLNEITIHSLPNSGG